MRWRPWLTLILAGICASAHAQAETPAAPDPSETRERDATWHARVGFGLNPVSSTDDRLPTAHMGFGASLSGFIQLPYRFSAGAGVDWERYTFDSKAVGDADGSPPRFTGEILTHTRVMALVQWDILRRRLLTPFILAGLGYGWEHAELTTWQCSPALMSGRVLGGGAGLDLAVHELIAVGLEYRINTLPHGTLTCTLAFIRNEPVGPPSDFVSQRIGITLSVRH